ncbi:hypothetical protein ACFY4C_40925 [Actinomadura viridis]|uniref:hypothetical protein n=1 Tax=Actinomadura viridis TaxID=58110 RepID=UPI0036C7A47D
MGPLFRRTNRAGTGRYFRMRPTALRAMVASGQICEVVVRGTGIDGEAIVEVWYSIQAEERPK